MSWVYLYGLVVSFGFAAQQSNAEMMETCNGEDVSVACRTDEVLLVTFAEYGRRQMGRCINKEEPHMGCTTDVLPLLDRWCSGRQNCEFPVVNPDFEEKNKNSDNSCPDYLRMYLKIDYRCMSVLHQCTTGGSDLRVEEGLLSSHVTDQTGCGSSRSPWKIYVNQGKTINMTLFDFSASRKQSAPNYVTCRHIYGYIIEKSLGINQTICGGQDRERALYSSKTNSVEVHLTANRGPDMSQFLIRYEAYGCSELKRPPNTWYKREGNEAVIGCETNDEEWRLTCTGNTWRGAIGNCTREASEYKPIEAAPEVEVGFTSMIIMTGIACGVVVAVVVAVMCGVIYLKKYRMKQETRRIQTTYATMEKQHHSYYRPINDTSASSAPETDAPSERLVDVSGTWVHADTFGRHGTMTS